MAAQAEGTGEGFVLKAERHAKTRAHRGGRDAGRACRLFTGFRPKRAHGEGARPLGLQHPRPGAMRARHE
eukprot:5908050-Prymnesium_polylepis.2